MSKAIIKNDLCIGLLLAAGKGERFTESLKEDTSRHSSAKLPLLTHKLLQPFDHHITVFEASLKNLCRALNQIIVVIPPRQEFVDIANRYHVKWAINTSPEKGMSFSLQLGVQEILQQKEIIPRIQGIIVALADMPAIEPKTIQTVIKHLITPSLSAIPPQDRVVRPFFCQKFTEAKSYMVTSKQFGHPVGIGLSYAGDIMKQVGDVGAKSLFKKYNKNVIQFPSADDGILIDIDTQTMLLQARSFVISKKASHSKT